MRKTDIAYLAGLFDGEGDAAVRPYKASKNGALYDRLTVRVTNTNLEALEWIRDLLGFGHIVANYNEALRRKRCYRYMVANANAATMLRIMRPYLIIKAKHVDKILSGKLSGRTVVVVPRDGIEPSAPTL